MTNAGKKPQDILDAGSSKLKELEQTQLTAFQEIGQSQNDLGSTSHKTSLEQARQRAKELQAELQSGLEKSAERLQKKIESETEETKRHVQEMLHNISKLTAQLEQSMSELNAMRRSDLEHLKTEACHLLEREVEDKSVELQKHDYQIVKTFKGQSAFVVNTFQQKLEHGLVEIRGEDQLLNSKLFKALLQNTTSIDTHVASLLQTLTGEYKATTEGLTSKFEHSQQLLRGHVEVLVNKAEQTASQVEKQFNESCSALTGEAESSLESRISQDAAKLHEMLDKAVADVSSVFAESSNIQESTGQTVHEAVANRCQEIRQQVAQQSAAAVAASKHRLQSSLHLQQSLEAATEASKEKFRQEFAALEQGFHQQIASSTGKSSGQMTDCCNEALESIYRAQQDAEKELQAMTRVCSKQINSALTGFLRQLEDKRNLALTEIQNAVSGQAPEPATKPNGGSQTSKKGKKTKSKEEPEIAAGE